jgi:4-alpha-glucanotransferase
MLLNFPREELFAILALESQHGSCLVLGEDLGTLPEWLSRAMRVRAMLSSAVLYFEQVDEGRFHSPRDYPTQSVATAATHDLPHLVGYWEGRDIAVRQPLGIFSTVEADQAQERRLDDCRRLGEALASAAFPLPTPADCMQYASSDLHRSGPPLSRVVGAAALPTGAASYPSLSKRRPLRKRSRGSPKFAATQSRGQRRAPQG